MTRSDRSVGCPETILDRAAGLLDEGELFRRVVEPFERASVEIRIETGPASSSAEFVDRTAQFVQQLYFKAMHYAVAPERARDELYVLLEESWPGGFCGAVIDATDPQQCGIGPILQHVAQTIGARCAQRYTRWVLQRRIESCDWRAKCRMAEILLQRNRDWLPAAVRQRGPELWAEKVPRILALSAALRQH